MKKLILLSGKINCGKNQFATYLREAFEVRELRVTNDLFARSLKDGCKEDFSKLKNVLNSLAEEIKTAVFTFTNDRDAMFSQASIETIEKAIDKLRISDENWYEDKTDITRNILQLYGTEIFRKRVDEDWWVKQLRNRAIATDTDIVLVTDTRFPNEIDGIVDGCADDGYETIAIRIQRTINTERQIAEHASETALDGWKRWDFVVENEGTLDDLKKSAEVIVREVLDNKEEETGLFTRLSTEQSQCLSKIL